MSRLSGSYWLLVIGKVLCGWCSLSTELSVGGIHLPLRTPYWYLLQFGSFTPANQIFGVRYKYGGFRIVPIAITLFGLRAAKKAASAFLQGI